MHKKQVSVDILLIAYDGLYSNYPEDKVISKQNSSLSGMLHLLYASEGPDWLPKMKSAIQCTFLYTACPLIVTQ